MTKPLNSKHFRLSKQGILGVLVEIDSIADREGYDLDFWDAKSKTKRPPSKRKDINT